MDALPIPNYQYNDGVIKYMTGKGFITHEVVELFPITTAYVDLVTYHNARIEGHFCHNPSCSKHKDILPKYAAEEVDGCITMAEHLSLLSHFCEPSNAAELAVVMYASAMLFGERKATQEMAADNPLARLFPGATIIEASADNASDALAELRRKMGLPNEAGEKSADAALNELLGSLKHERDTKSTAKVPGDAFVFNRNVKQQGPWHRFNLTEERYNELVAPIIETFKRVLTDEYPDISSISGDCWDNSLAQNVDEHTFVAWCIGMYSEKAICIRNDLRFFQ